MLLVVGAQLGPERIPLIDSFSKLWVRTFPGVPIIKDHSILESVLGWVPLSWETTN